jgi:hypothetical protein
MVSRLGSNNTLDGFWKSNFHQVRTLNSHVEKQLENQPYFWYPPNISFLIWYFRLWLAKMEWNSDKSLYAIRPFNMSLNIIRHSRASAKIHRPSIKGLTHHIICNRQCEAFLKLRTESDARLSIWLLLMSWVGVRLLPIHKT